jgi:phosphate transport system substrate-binding protein
MDLSFSFLKRKKFWKRFILVSIITPIVLFFTVVLIVYAKQDAIVTIDGQNVKLNADGTFKVSLPFVDNLVDYQMTATSANEENTKTIYQKFFQEQKEN